VKFALVTRLQRWSTTTHLAWRLTHGGPGTAVRGS